MQTIISEDLAGPGGGSGTRFPPEPNGYLHIGHAKSISVNFGLAEANGGRCNLRFDDTNPEKESRSISSPFRKMYAGLGYQWSGEVRYASSYFQQLYDWAVYLVEQGKAYVCDLMRDEAREYRGTLTEPGRNSPYRDAQRAKKTWTLLERMKAGEFDEGCKGYCGPRSIWRRPT